MNIERIQYLLSQEEGANLEFKQEFYKIDADSQEARKRQRHELIKDILSLANGNESVAGEPAYLIVGAGDDLDSLGGRDLYDMRDVDFPTPSGLLSMVNAYCEPPLGELQSFTVEIDGKQLFVVMIPPSPYLHELTKKLETPSQTYSKFVTLVRHNESVQIASAKQRAAIIELKQIKLAEMENPPRVVGGLVGLTLGFIAGGISPFPLTEDRDFNEEISPYVGGVVGGVLGEAIGASHYLKYKLQKEHPDRFKLLEMVWLGSILIGGYILLFILKEALKRLGLQSLFPKGTNIGMD